MVKIAPEQVWNFSEKELLELLESRISSNASKELHFYAPSFTYYKTKHCCSSPTSFPTISVTGASCALNCKHCGGKVLETMRAAPSADELFNLCVKLKDCGAKGCLISGGCLPDGTVPLDGFVDAIKLIKGKLGLTVFVHTGIIGAETAFALKKAGVDAALIDVIGSTETLRKTFNLKTTLQDYANSLYALETAELSFVPHVIVGLNEGKLDGEFEALKMISNVEPSALVIIAFMPIVGTAMATSPPPTPLDIAKVVATARLMFPQTPLILGCMRPKGKVRGSADVLALKAGVDAIAFPSEEAIEYALIQGSMVSFSSFCCAQMYLDAAKKR